MSVLIIAEAGVNHNGDIQTAIKMIECAANAGADVIKFQTFVPELLVSKSAKKAAYQKETTGREESQLDMIRKYELPYDAYPVLLDCCKINNIAFLSTPFDLQSIEFLIKLNMPYWKIPSGEITNLPYLLNIAKTGKPVLLSTGMSTINEITEAVHVLKDNGNEDITVLHCTTEYPAPIAEVNLRAMETIRRETGLKVGYSDHTEGIEVSIAAVALGAVVIEKHFTLDKTMEGPDHKASLEPSELSDMIKAIRNIEKAMGSGEKVASLSERKNMEIVRKSIVAKSKINKDEPLTVNNLTTKRPGNGISPMRWFDVLGTKAIRDFEEDELIEL
jgi:N,N'-diacetyllegionaminate synthase